MIGTHQEDHNFPNIAIDIEELEMQAVRIVSKRGSEMRNGCCDGAAIFSRGTPMNSQPRRVGFSSLPLGPFAAAVGNTALWTSAMRSQETSNPNGLFSDPFAEKWGRDEAKQILKMYEDSVEDTWLVKAAVFRRMQKDIICIRHRYFDDLLLQLMNNIAAKHKQGRVSPVPWPRTFFVTSYKTAQPKTQ